MLKSSWFLTFHRPKNPSKIDPDIWSDHEKWISNLMIKHYITVWRVQWSGCLWGKRNFETLKPGLLKTFPKNNTQLRQNKDKMLFNSTNSPKVALSNFDYYVITTLEKPKTWKWKSHLSHSSRIITCWNLLGFWVK